MACLQKPGPSCPVPTTVFLLPLRDNGSPDVGGQYVCLPPPLCPTVTKAERKRGLSNSQNDAYILRFSIQGTSSVCQDGSLWINVPTGDDDFVPHHFQEFKLQPDFNKSIHVDIPIRHSGAFTYYLTYSPLPEFNIKPSSESRPPERTDDFFINVEPRITLNGQHLPFGSITLISVLSKFMGDDRTKWKDHLAGIAARGYNFVHFTPLNIRGESNSPYSIYDQLQFDKAVFPNGEEDVRELTSAMESDLGLLSLCDVVWNHTANNSDWLLDHPDAGYNAITAPHLESAIELDTALTSYSHSLGSYGKPTELKSTDDLDLIMDGIELHCISGIRLWEFYICKKDSAVESVLPIWQNAKSIDSLKQIIGQDRASGLDSIRDRPMPDQGRWLIDNGGVLNIDRMGERFRKSPEPNTLAYLLHLVCGPPEADSGKIEAAKVKLLEYVDAINQNFYKEYDADKVTIMTQLYNRIKYLHIDEGGPKQGPITKASPLTEPYFTHLPLNEKTKKHDPRSLALVNNGWVWAANALRDNAGPDSKAYLLREVIVWGDCVKLRYGDKREDSPYLWDRMTEYTHLMAKHFHAFRIDNCHSTPIHVAAYLLNEARRTRPNLAVFAELFSGSEEMDYLFVRRLNLNGLIREAMQSYNTQEMSRIVHRQSGRPIGSFDSEHIETITSQEKDEKCHEEAVRTIRASQVHPLFMDCTHDNETPAQKRDARDTLPNSALVAMCACSTGSVMGYDEIYPELLNLVTEPRKYNSPYTDAARETKGGIPDISSIDTGIGACKAIFNDIHKKLSDGNFDESFIHHEREYITVHRMQPHSRNGYFCIAHTAYPGSDDGRGSFGPVRLPGNEAEFVGAWILEVDQSEETKARVSKDKSALRGLPSKVVAITDVKVEHEDSTAIIHLPDSFGPGSVALFKTKIPSVNRAVKDVFPDSNAEVDEFMITGAAKAFATPSLTELNLLLYRCEPEEMDQSSGEHGAYQVPGMGNLVYCGLQGWWSVLEPIIRRNDLGHPLCDHLRKGNWAMDYIVERLVYFVEKQSFKGLEGPLEWLKSRFAVIKQLPEFLHPRYFALVLRTAFYASVNRNMSLLPAHIGVSHTFLQSLALVSTQMCGLTKNASLWPNKVVSSMSAGLPHFSTDWARCWGRDIMISLRGLCLCTGRFDVAREHIFAFASVVQHGMIPNLLSAGRLPRYNARDSTWFFLQAIQDYVKIAPDGKKLLKERVKRRFLPYDDTWFSHEDERAYSQESSIEEIIQEILQKTASGIHFREHNAGPDLDQQMSDPGFNIDIEVDWETGLLFGGNQHNCGTWMDKMGESEKAGSKGVPGTPRDGAAVEIIGLLYSALDWVAGLANDGDYPHTTVKKSDGVEINISDWASLIRSNFECCFYVPLKAEEDVNYEVDSKLVNRRGVYKDLYRSGKPYEDYQLRPNVQIAMTVAPALFKPSHAIRALHTADKVLRGPLGMATLDPSDLNYRPYYRNSDDSTDFATAKGRNYHQGPEWVWPLGYHLRALLHFVLRSVSDAAAGHDVLTESSCETWSAEVLSAKHMEVFQHLHARLSGCRAAIQADDNPWRGLTELTQKDGEYCHDSSPTQAWSAACLLDLFYDAGAFAK